MLSATTGLPQKITDLLFFDNLALYYVTQNTPLEVLARVLRTADARLAGSILGILSVEERKRLHVLMAVLEQKSEPEKDKAAQDGILLIAGDQCKRGLIQKQGLHFYGLPNEEP